MVELGFHLHLASLDALAQPGPFTLTSLRRAQHIRKSSRNSYLTLHSSSQTFYTVSASALPLGAPRRLKPNSATSLGGAHLSQQANILALPHLPPAASSVLALELSALHSTDSSTRKFPAFRRRCSHSSTLRSRSRSRAAVVDTAE